MIRGCLIRPQTQAVAEKEDPLCGTGQEIETGHEMRLNLAEELLVDASPDDVWRLLRDTPRLTGLLPGVESVALLDGDRVEAYGAKVSEKIGPFKIMVNLEVRVTETCEPSLLKASLKGADSASLTRVTGNIQVTLRPALSATKMHFEASIEVLGKLTTLGAIPIRRRTTQLFAEFARSVQEQFAKESS